MTTARQLYSLQELDLGLSQIDDQIAGAEAELFAGNSIDQIVAALKAETDRLQEVRGLHRQQQLEAESQRERSTQLDSQLYSGALTNSRDLQSLEQEASNTRDLLQQRDAELLQLSIQVEEAQNRSAELENKLAETQAVWSAREAELLKSMEQLTVERLSVDGKRSSLAATLEAAALQRYETLRKAKGGLAVAKVVRGLCQGCRMALPTQQQQRVRSGRQTVLCSTCGRILFLS